MRARDLGRDIAARTGPDQLRYGTVTAKDAAASTLTAGAVTLSHPAGWNIEVGDVVGWQTNRVRPVLVSVEPALPAVEALTVIPGTPGFANYGLGFEPLRVSKSGRLCAITGLISQANPVAPAFVAVATLPARFWPANRHVFTVHDDVGAVRRFDVDAAGNVFVLAIAAQLWITIHGTWPAAG